MSMMIDFLEKMGADARLRHADASVLNRELAHSRFVDPFRSAILSGDVRALETTLGADANTCCVVHVPDGDEPLSRA